MAAGGTTAEGRRWLIWVQFYNIFLDFPFFCLGAVLVCTVYRGVALLCDLFWPDDSKNPHLPPRVWTASQRRWAVAGQFLMLLFDVLALPSFLVVLVTFYRLPHVLRALHQKGTIGLFNRFCRNSSTITLRIESHLLLLLEVFNIINDFPFLAMALVIFVTLWRLPGLCFRLWQRLDMRGWCACSSDIGDKFSEFTSSLAHRFHRPTGHEAKQDGMDSPLDGVSQDVIKHSLLPFLNAKDIANFSATNAHHYYVQNSNKLWRPVFERDFFEEIPVLNVAGLAAYDRQVRSGQVDDTSRIWKLEYGRAELNRKTAMQARLAADDIIFEGWYLHGFRKIVFAEFLEWLCDLPALILGLVAFASILRTKSVASDVAAMVPSWVDVKGDRHWMRGVRLAAVENFFMIFFDLLTVPCWIINLITIYKFRVLWQENLALPHHSYSLFDPAHRHARWETYPRVLMSTLDLLLDVPFNLMFLLSFHRAVNVTRQLEAEGKSFGKSEHRGIACQQFLEFILDIPFFVMLVAELIFLPRLIICLLKIKYHKTVLACGWTEVPQKLVRAAIFANFWAIPIDIIGMALCVVIFATFWRFPLFCQMLKRQRGFRRSVAQCMFLIFKDIFTIGLLLPIILIGIQRVPRFFRLACALVGEWNNMESAEAHQAKRTQAERLRKRVAEAKADSGEKAKESEVQESAAVAEELETELDELFDRALHSLRSEDGFGVFWKDFNCDDYSFYEGNFSGYIHRPPELPRPWTRVDDEQKMAEAKALSKAAESDLERGEAAGPVEKAADGKAAAGKAADGAPKKLDLDNLLGTKDNTKKRKMINTDYFWSLSFLRHLFLAEAYLSVVLFHNVLLFPVRCLGYLFFPVWYYIRHRVDDEDEENAAPPPGLGAAATGAIVGPSSSNLQPATGRRPNFSKSFLFRFVAWLYKLSPHAESRNFEKFELFIVTNVLSIPPLLLNELAVLTAFLMNGLMLVVTFFQKKSWRSEGWRSDDWRLHDETRDAEPTIGQSLLLYLSFLLQGATLPLFVGYLAVLPVSPAVLSVAVSPGWAAVFTDGFSAIPSLPAWVWALCAPTAVIALASLELQCLFAQHRALMFRPWLFFYLFLIEPLYLTFRGEGI